MVRRLGISEGIALKIRFSARPLARAAFSIWRNDSSMMLMEDFSTENRTENVRQPAICGVRNPQVKNEKCAPLGAHRITFRGAERASGPMLPAESILGVFAEQLQPAVDQIVEGASGIAAILALLAAGHARQKQKGIFD